MKRFDFSQTGGFPLTQDRLKWMQDGYIEAIHALGSLQGPVGSCAINGVELTSGSWGASGTVSDGWIYSADWGLLPFIGGEFTPAKSNVAFAVDEFPSPPNPLVYESGAPNNVQIRRVAKIGNGVSNNLRNLSQTRWGEKFGLNNRTGWVGCQLASGSNGSVQMMHDRLTGLVRIRGNISRTTTAFSIVNNGFPWVECALVPTTGILPSNTVYFQTSMPEPVKDTLGNWHINSNGKLDTTFVVINGQGGSSAMRLMLQAIQPPGNIGSTNNMWTQYFDFSYKV